MLPSFIMIDGTKYLTLPEPPCPDPVVTIAVFAMWLMLVDGLIFSMTCFEALATSRTYPAAGTCCSTKPQKSPLVLNVWVYFASRSVFLLSNSHSWKWKSDNAALKGRYERTWIVIEPVVVYFKHLLKEIVRGC